MSICSCQNKKFDKLREIIAEKKGTAGALIPVMHEAQELFGHLPIHVQSFIAEALEVPMADVYGVATFYSAFTLEAKGTYSIHVCLGTACYVKGAQAIVDKLAELLHIKVGETTEDGLFTLEATRCIGACGLAPVLTVNNEVYSQVSVEQIDGIVHKYMEMAWKDEEDGNSSTNS
ncbi:NAD(P)H-dependent oxidoreductase subunit E [Heliorestis acidaminivorans]|uniref:NAD(P)H-dependent oxidoreductase subunit E n=1 Tax=Heliorestis acidaminivorans TaxID=553427 RepID=A0A6I0F0H0_9FIRM|nr:NAD(P)H-dependent oxidoreductase subunit E [Heliorestis acidaminivorans]KAB2953356.1 NAD(P)H-dependent oxidoreductase subunit E [Heliorestis acidaminivorans]